MGQVQPTFMKIVEILMRGLHCTLDGVVMQKVGRAPSRSPSLVDNYPLIQKKQISIPMFCCSPLKNDSLQKHIKASHLEELYLPCLQSAWLAGIPCCKCWYDSYFWKTELKKYYLTIASFGKILINEDENEGDMDMLIDLVEVLETMDIGSVNIPVNDSFLFDANQIMEFAFAKRMHEQLFKRSDEHPLLSGILHQLLQSSDSSLTDLKQNGIMRDLCLPLLIRWNHGNRRTRGTSTSNRTEKQS